MQPEGSLPHSQVPATCPYPEPARSSPCPHIPLPEDPSHYHPPIYAWVSQVVNFLQVSIPKPCILNAPFMLRARPSNPPWVDRPNDIPWAVHIAKLLYMHFPPASCYFDPDVLLRVRKEKQPAGCRAKHFECMYCRTGTGTGQQADRWKP